MASATTSAKDDLKILQCLHRALLPSHPRVQLAHHDSGRCILLPWKGNDAFLFDFSSKVPDGLRCCFVVDVLVKASDRRCAYARMLGAAPGALESALGCTVISRADDGDLANQGMIRWAKVSHHRRMGVYCIHRLPSADWTNENHIAQELAPIVVHFLQAMERILQTCEPPAV